MRKDGTSLGFASVTGISGEFGKFEFSFECAKADEDARFYIETESGGTLYVDFVSLFPEDTYGGEKNGFRKDILEFLKDMHPGFLRFPGGCVVEGINLENAIHWKKTIGPIEDRPGHWNLWNYRFTDGIGMLEYCKLGEILGADLMFVCNCAMSCQARRGGGLGDDTIEYWLQNALDGIEFIIGGTDTKWGAVRAEQGHPEPFNLKYVEIGNENSGPEYEKRFAIFRRAVREKYPDLTIIANCRIAGEDYDLVDDHYYTEPSFFPSFCGRYNGNDEEKIYVGEYACNSNVGYGNILSAVSEACFMTHMENRADRVRIASYAPLFCHDKNRRWPVNLINFDRAHVFGLPSYYVQKLFSINNVDNVVYTDLVPSGAGENLFVTAGLKDGDLIIKAVNFSDKPEKVSFVSPAIKRGKKELDLVAGENPEDTNSLLYPENVAVSVNMLICEEGKAELTLPAYSFAVIK